MKQSSLLNAQQYSSAQQGLQFAQTALKSSQLTYTSQETKLSQSFQQGSLTEDEYHRQLQQLQQQSKADAAPWEIYVKKLTDLIEKYSSRNGKRIHEPTTMRNFPELPSKRTRITFSSSSSSDSDTPIPVVVVKKPETSTSTYDRSTNTDPLEFFRRSSFPPTPNIISFTCQTNHLIRRIPLEQINEFAAEQIVLLHDQGQLVRWNDVVGRLFFHYHVEDLGHLGLQRVDQIPCLDHLIRLQNKINIYLDAYSYYHNLGTLGELEMDIARLFHKNSYQELFLGPIERQSKIEELFHLRSNSFIRKDLKSSDILKYLDQYMTKEHSWISEKDIQIIDFLKFIGEQIQVKHIYQLGIRIKSVYLARTCIKAMQANQRKTMEIARMELNQMLAQLAEKEVIKIRQTIEQDRQHYSTMDPIEVLDDLMEICRDLCHDYSSFKKLTHALQVIIKDSMLRNLFQIALCRGRVTTQPEPPPPTVLPKKIYFSSSEESSEDEKEVIKKILPSEQEILQAFKDQIGSLKSLNFKHLSRIEQRLCEKYQMKSFEEFHQGSFMKYLEQHDQVLFSSDMTLNLISSKSQEKTMMITKNITREDLEQFLRQAKEKTTDRSELEQLVNYHFQVQSFEQCGYGSLQSMINSIEEKQFSSSTDHHYECLIVDGHLPLKPIEFDVETRALSSIEQCPLLSNIAVDTQWNMVYRPRLGPLKGFLSRHRCSILQLDHQTFIKISLHSAIEQFRQSLEKKDPRDIAGHLLSILIQSNSCQYAPLSLLSTMIQTFYSTQIFNDDFYRFLFRIFHRIPSLILHNIIHRLFIEPLVTFEGSTRLIREKFTKIIAEQDIDTIRRFESLGFTGCSIPVIKSNASLPPPPPPPMMMIIPSMASRISNRNDPFDVISRIRREKFGIGLDLSIESQQLTEQLKCLVGRSLERLSKELYNNDMHFVLELIQNADDNQYNQCPALVFVIDDQSIEIYNNEIGFEEDHIQALCNIGKSTKGKHQQGYIGQKGIGFKSVFTVTDRPEIYSNGYQICFDAHDGPIGYILPQWIDEQRKNEEYAQWNTRISLPLKSQSERDKHRSRSLIESFHDIQSSLLLFLNRLRSITIDNRLTQTKQIYQRDDLPGSHIVRIQGGHIEEQWFVLKRTQIALAFPLHEYPLLTKKEIFAYLPLRSFGFTFIIQGDFEVPSSRQDILSDSQWNHSLLQEIPSLFLSSLDAFKQESTLLPIDPLHLFLQFLPHPSSIFGSPLFTSVSRSILQSLRTQQFLPVINQCDLYRPDQCVLLHDPSIRTLVTPDLLSIHLNLYYLDEQFSSFSSILYELGVHRLGHEQLIEFIQRILKSDVTMINRSQLGQWFHCLYRCLNDLSVIDEEQVLLHLRSLNIIPLKNDHQWISLNSTEEFLFFPSKNLSLPQLIEDDLLIIDDQFDLDSLTKLQVQSCLERIGIVHLSHRSIIDQHLYPMLKNKSQWQKKSIELRNTYVMYLFDVWTKDNYSFDMIQLKSLIELSTNEYFRSPIEYPIYFSWNYNHCYDLTKDFPLYPWIILSDNYLQEISSEHKRRKLHQFFIELGVKDFLLPIHQWTMEQFNALIDYRSISINQRLFLLIQQYYIELNDIEQRCFIDTSFFNQLKQSKWIPSIDKSFHQPNEIYVRNPIIDQLLSHHVPYVDINESIDPSFANHLGLLNQLTLSQFISQLIHWSQSSQFFTSRLHMQHVYEYLGQQMNREELTTLLEEYPLIFLPSQYEDRSVIVQGRFVHRSRVCWSDASNLFNKYPLGEQSPSTLQIFYTDQQSLFITIFAIRLHPTMKEYFNLLSNVHFSHYLIYSSLVS